MKSRGTLLVGTSGWSYDWDGFYPPGLKSSDYLLHYAKRFDAVEVNYTFYRLPREKTFERWRTLTPENFCFALKLSRFITHVKRLVDAGEAIGNFMERASVLGSKMGPILVQLPPSLEFDKDVLDGFLSELTAARRDGDPARRIRAAVEFRHRSWFEDERRSETAKTLATHEAAWVFAHSKKYPYPEEEPITSDFIYLRFHGPEKLFASKYGKAGLRRWVPRIRSWLDGGLDVFAFFNNDVEGFAYQDARTLEESLASLDE